MNSQQRTRVELLQQFFGKLRGSIATGQPLPDESTNLLLNWGRGEPWGIAIAVYQPGLPRIMVVRRLESAESIFAQLIAAVRSHPRFNDFDVVDSSTALQLDFIIDQPVVFDLSQASERSLAWTTRFELGVDGLRLSHDERVQYFLPGDAFVRSILGLGQLQQYIRRQFPKIDSEAVIAAQRFQSSSFLNLNGDTCFLYRGYPTDEHLVGPSFSGRFDVARVQRSDVGMSDGVLIPDPIPPSIDQLMKSVHAGVRWLIDHQSSDGRFTYYYDSATGTTRDHEHPSREEGDRYYNLLRHCGAVITLSFYHQLLRQVRDARQSPHTTGVFAESLADAEWIDADRISNAVRIGCQFFCSTLKPSVTSTGKQAAYAKYNRKAKLGGSGLGLYMLCCALEHCGEPFDDAFSNERRLLANHLIDSVFPSGEFRYYHEYLDEFVDEERNAKLFSFYYPGEALIGLVAYLRTCTGLHTCTGAAESVECHTAIQRALHFLLVERPQRYQDQFQSLPSDGWLMMALNEYLSGDLPRQDLLDGDAIGETEYARFVLADACAMTQRQYTPDDAIYADYTGSFYYKHGDHPYPDGARGEGLLAALELAAKRGDAVLHRKFDRALDRLAWATHRLTNRPTSLYSAQDPGQSLGGIRFKFTRQWFRIDTIQHVAGMYIKYFIHQLTMESQGAQRLATMLQATGTSSSTKKLCCAFSVTLLSDAADSLSTDWEERWHIAPGERTFSEHEMVAIIEKLRHKCELADRIEIKEVVEFEPLPFNLFLEHASILFAGNNLGIRLEVRGDSESACLIPIAAEDFQSVSARELVETYLKRDQTNGAEISQVSVSRFRYRWYELMIRA